jgi:carbon-monoxide dehydrogenase large subunit
MTKTAAGDDQLRRLFAPDGAGSAAHRDHPLESASPLNPIGVKGAGEGGTIPAAACIISAIENAVAPFNVRIVEHPISPARLRQLIRAAETAGIHQGEATMA